MKRIYYVEQCEKYAQFVREDAYYWWDAGYRADELTVDDVLTEYRERIAWLTESEAYAATFARADRGMYSAEKLCNDLRSAIAELEEERGRAE